VHEVDAVIVGAGHNGLAAAALLAKRGLCLYLCGASCHPGPGVTFLPGFGCAMEVARALGSAESSR